MARVFTNHPVFTMPTAGGAYIFRDFQTSAVFSNVKTYSVDIGTANAGRLVIVAAGVQSAGHTAIVVVNGVTLSTDVINSAGRTVIIASGIVASGSGVVTVTVTWDSGTVFEDSFVGLWTTTSANAIIKHTAIGTTTTSIPVTAGDFLFASNIVAGTGNDFATSTQVPFHFANGTPAGGSGIYGGIADWTVASTNASFSAVAAIGGVTAVASYGSGPGYVFRGSDKSSSGFPNVTFAIDIGPAAADRLVIVASNTSNDDNTLAAVIVNGVTLNIDVAGTQQGIASGLVPSGSGVQNIEVTWTGSGFEFRSLYVWTAAGLNSNVVKHVASGSSPQSINVDAGDFLFAIGGRVGGINPSFSSSTEAPDGSRSQDDTGSFFTGADWTINATNAAFSVVADVAWGLAAASYR